MGINNNHILDLAYMEYNTLLWEYQKVRHDYEIGEADIEDVCDILKRLKEQEKKIKR